MRFKCFILISFTLVVVASCTLNTNRQKTNNIVVVNNTPHLKPKYIDRQIKAILDSLDEQGKIIPSNAGNVHEKAEQIKEEAEKLCIHIDSIKTLLISQTDGIPWSVADTIALIDIDSKENFDVPTRIMVNTAAAEDGSKGLAHPLKLMLGQYRKQVLSALAMPADSSKIKIGLLTPDVFNKPLNENQTWEQFNFEEQPLAAVLITLIRLQNDVGNAELAGLRELLQSENIKK